MTFEEWKKMKGFPVTSTQEPLWRTCWETAQEQLVAAPAPEWNPLFKRWETPVPNNAALRMEVSAPDADKIMALADTYAANAATYDKRATLGHSEAVLDKCGDDTENARATLRAAVERVIAENSWFREAINVRDAEDQRTIDVLKERTCRLNLEMDVRRLAGWEKPINGFECLNELQAAHDAWMEMFQRAEQERDAFAADVLRLIATIKYLSGIAERGEGRPIRKEETTEQFVLGYVKRLERAERELADARSITMPALQSALNSAQKRVERAEQDAARLRELLKEARNQIEYMHDKYGSTGTGYAVIARIDAMKEGK